MTGTFEKLASFKTEFDGIQISKYKSSETGLQVVHVDCESPLVNGYFVLATEALDDDGCPHTLEHLIFLGSEDYPYKGVLDSLANRALARGTNAWTAVDHTAYTLTTAGSQGFLSMLPIYMDHILYPTLTDSGFVTEIHHIDEKGEDAGVVYSEMQGRENTQGDLCYLALQRALFPGSGYASETGGIMANLRVLTLEKIKTFHKQFYRPDNLGVIVTGKVDETELMSALARVEQKIVSKGKLEKVPTPWVDSKPPAPLNETVRKVVEFPDELEESGSVTLAWKGPAFDDHVEIAKLHVIDEYLTDSVISLLQKEFVEMDDPYASSVSIGFLRYIEEAINVDFDGVPKSKLDSVEEHFFDVINKHLSEGLDADRLKMVIEKRILKLQESAETEPAEFFLHPLITDMLYGKKQHSLQEALITLEHIKSVQKLSIEDWISTIRKYFVDQPFVRIIGMPSATLMNHLQASEKERYWLFGIEIPLTSPQFRIEKQRTALGESRLAELKEKLEKAKAANEVVIPPTVFDEFGIPDVEGIKLIKVETATTTDDPESSALAKKVTRIPGPFYMQFDHIKSEFLEITLFFDTQKLPKELKPYLELFLDCFYSLPLEHNGDIIDHEQVVQQLERDTVEYSNAIGVSSSGSFFVGPFGQLLVFTVKVEKAKYDIGVEWLYKLLFSTVFAENRLLISANKLLNEIPKLKREGAVMSSKGLSSLLYDPKMSNIAACSLMKQEKFLASVVKLISEGSGETVSNALRKLRTSLVSNENVRCHVAGNIMSLDDVMEPWSRFGDPSITERLPIQYSRSLLTELGKKPSKKINFISMPAIESCFMNHVAKGPSSFEHEDVAALKVLIEYLTTMEGIFWKEVRGTGLAYGVGMNLDLEAGLIRFSIYRSPDVFNAFEVVKRIMADKSAGKIPFDSKFIEAAKSSVSFSIISQQETSSAAATVSFVNNVLKGVDREYVAKLLKAVQLVKISDMERVLKTYISPLFDSETSCGVIAAPPSKIDTRFGQFGYQIEQLQMEDLIQ